MERQTYLLFRLPLIDSHSTTVTLNLNSKSMVFKWVLYLTKYLLVLLLYPCLLENSFQDTQMPAEHSSVFVLAFALK